MLHLFKNEFLTKIYIAGFKSFSYYGIISKTKNWISSDKIFVEKK